jgi:hypothetical protein
VDPDPKSATQRYGSGSATSATSATYHELLISWPNVNDVLQKFVNLLFFMKKRLQNRVQKGIENTF